MIRWLEANGYDVTYSDRCRQRPPRRADQEPQGVPLGRARRVLVGHAARERRGRARRRRPPRVLQRQRRVLEDPLGAEHRSHRRRRTARSSPTRKRTATPKIDPVKDVWTGTWRDSRPFNPEGPKPENALKGTIFTVNAWRNDPLVVPARFAPLRFWRNTEVAQLKAGQQAVLGYGILGHEWNEDLDNGFRPAGPDAPVRDDGQQRPLHPGLRHRLRRRHGDAPPDALPRAERRAGLQRRHGAMGVGPRPEPRHRDRHPAGARA